jgi:hypothetical protein
MIRRLIGLLMILSLLFPPLIGAAALLTLNDLAAHLQTTSDARFSRLDARLDQLELAVNTATSRYDALKAVSEQVRAAAQAAAQDVATIDNFTVPGEGVGSTTFDMGAVREHLQNLYNSLGSLSSALSDATVINQIPGQVGEVVGETQGWYSDVNDIAASYAQIFLTLGVALVVWLALVYLVLVYRWGRQGWALLSGQAG